METTYNFLLDLALILLTTKILGLVTRRYNMPQVVGALLAGLLMGPACLNILHETTFIHDAAEIGVVVLMFCAGMETDIDELKKSGKASFVIALLGVLVPLAGGSQCVFTEYFYRCYPDGNVCKYQCGNAERDGKIKNSFR